MKKKSNSPVISRRAFVASAISACGATLVSGCKSSTEQTQDITMKDNKDFYKNGEFDAAKGKQAYIDMMKRFGYPVFDQFAGDLLWAIDFGLGDFTGVGMGGVFWSNENHEGGGYLGHEIFLLPGQMIVEHSHVNCDTCPPKRESWLVRHGSAYSFSVQDEPKGFPDGAKIPESQKDFITVNSAKLVGVGEVDTLNKAKAKHFLLAGPEGCIVTEFATFHDNEALRFTNPGVKF